jgi:hypothetical protein
MKASQHQKIDELYKLPLEEFTHARNALAKSLLGNDKKHVASLIKPSLAMWVVNQLYWKDAPTYKALIDASEKLREAHRAALNGRKVDTNKADELHRTTLAKAFAKATTIAQKKATSITDTVRDAVRRTLAALPTDEAPGRLMREPPPVGFSLLTGIKPRSIETNPPKRSEKERPSAPATGPSPQELRRQKLEEKRRKEADAKARKEAERARKEQEKRERAIKKAEQALRDAERRLAELKR